ncbi:MAG: hypothetical protein ABIH00_11560 [Armatimonadota bacterium]
MHKKTFIILLVLAAFLAQAVMAAPQMQAMKQKQGQQCEGMLNLIPDLTDAQKQQIKTLLQEEKKEVKQVKEKYKTKIEQVLTPEQLQKLKSTIADKMADKMASVYGKKLSLTTEQQVQVKQIIKKYQDQMCSKADKNSRFETMKKINEEIKTILTDQQKAKFDEMQKQMKGLKQKQDKSGNCKECKS